MRPSELGPPSGRAVLVETTVHGHPGLHWCEVVEIIESGSAVRARVDGRIVRFWTAEVRERRE